MKKVADKITTILCDDIRREVGNKDSLMGIYQDIIVESIPSMLLRLSFMVYLSGLINEIEKCKICLTMPESEPIEMPLKVVGSAGQKRAKIAVTTGPIPIKAEGQGIWEVFINDSRQPKITHEFDIKIAIPAKTGA
jgi:hypothetical protein